MITYALTSSSTVTRLPDMASIPADPANSDYAKYLRWLNGYTETIRAPGTFTPEVPATFDAEGNELTPAIPGYWTEGEILEVIEHPPHTPEPYVPPPPAIPQSISMRQARLALLGAGLLDQVNAGMASMPQTAQIEWEFASEVRRDNALIGAMATALGLDDAALDALFVAGSAL